MEQVMFLDLDGNHPAGTSFSLSRLVRDKPSSSMAWDGFMARKMTLPTRNRGFGSKCIWRSAARRHDPALDRKRRSSLALERGARREAG
jgi:hypothetical protein